MYLSRRLLNGLTDFDENLAASVFRVWEGLRRSKIFGKFKMTAECE